MAEPFDGLTKRERLLDQLAAAFRAFDACWAQITDSETRYYQLGSHHLCLEFAGQYLQTILADAFAHLRTNGPLEDSFAIRIWDCNEQRLPLPSLDWNVLHAHGYRGFSDSNYCFHYFESIGALSFVNLEEKRAYYVVRDARALPWWVRGSPLQVILGIWLRSQGTQLTHVAAVGDDKHCVLLAGKGGSGKTTTALSCVLGGLNYLGEDYCLLTPGESPLVHSIYQTAKWTPQTRRFYPEFEHFVTNPESGVEEKSLLFYQQMFPERIQTALPARAVISLSVGDADMPRIRATALSTSLKNLSLSTVRQLPFFDTTTLNLLRSFATGLQHFEIQLGFDRGANVNAIRVILAGQV